MIRTRTISAFAAACLSMAACSGGQTASPSASEYVSPVYGFAISYPDSFDLREYTSEYIAIGRAEGDGFDAMIELAVEVNDRADASFEDFIIARARLTCAADGPDLSLECGDVQARQPYTSDAGVAGEAIYLEHITTRPTTGEVLREDGRGPFFIFALARQESSDTVGLIIRPPVSRRAAEANSELIRAVAASLRS